MNKLTRLSGNPAATQRSQNLDTISISGVPASPACVSHADISAKNASFMLRVYQGQDRCDEGRKAIRAKVGVMKKGSSK